MGKIGNALSKIGTAGKNGVRNFANNAKDSVKSGLKNAVKKAIPKVVKIKIYLTVGIALLVVVLIAALVQLLRDVFGKSDKATSIKVTTAEFQQQASAESLELYKIYGSCIGFTLDQINELSNELTKKDGIYKNNDILREAYSSKFGYISDDKKGSNIEKEYKRLLDSNGNLSDSLTDYQQQIVKYYKSLKGNVKNSISIYDNVPIYTHCLRAEKYNFNNIRWKAYNHGESVKDVDSNEFAYDSNLGLYYPTKGNPSLMNFVKEYSPYLLSSKIPAAYLGASNYTTEESSKIGKSQMDAYQDKIQGKTSDVGNFAYLTLQYAQSDITVNQYNLKYLNETTSWEDYDLYTSKPTFSVEKRIEQELQDTGKKDSNGNPILEPVDVTRYYYVSGSYNDGREDRTNKGEHFNTRMEDGVEKEIKEKHEEWGEATITHYKLSSAITFDVNHTWSYNYSQYEQDDVDNRTNWDAVLEQWQKEFNRLPEGSSVQAESDFSSLGSDKLGEYYNSHCVTDNGNIHVCSGNEYQYEFGNTKYIKRQWQDKLDPEPTNQKKYLLGIKDLVSYNANPNKDQALQTVNAEDFNSDTKSVDYYKINIIDAKDLALNLVDIFNANPKLYLKYTTSAMAYSKYVGWTRNKQVIQQGNASIKTAFKEIENDNGGRLPFAYGASFGFDVGAEEAPVYNASGSTTGKRLMYEYIYQLEGTGTMKEEGGQKYYQIYTINEHRTVGHGLDLETSGKEGELIAMLERAGYSTSVNKGDWLPCEIVDTILDGEIDSWYQKIVAATAGLNLQEYQIHALTSRAVNAGYHSYMKYGSNPCNGSIDLVNAYNTYWHEDTDNKYNALFEKYGSAELDSSQESDVYSNVDYNNGLFTSYMAGPNNGGQLDNRRKSEWVLFQTGYYGYNTTIKKLYGMSGGSIIECAKSVHEVMEQGVYTYSLDTSKLKYTLEESMNGFPYTCCATYVTWVLQEAGYLEEGQGSHGAIALGNLMQTKGFIRIDDISQLEPGDLIVYTYGHIEIYAGDGTVYNAGATEVIRGASPHKRDISSLCARQGGTAYGLRAPN